MDRETLMQLDKEQLVNLLLAALEKIDKLENVIKQQAEEIAHLKEQINRNSKNSSKPPSSDGYKRPKNTSLRKPSGKKQGAQEGHEGHGFAIPHEPDETLDYCPASCEECGADLSNEHGEKVETRYSIDIEIRVKVTAYQNYKVTCPECGHTTKGCFPKHINSTKQYGEALQALVIALNTAGSVSISRTHEILHSVFSVPISTGTIVTMVKNCATKVNTALEAIKERLQSSDVVHFDETGIHVDKKLYWAHSASTGRLTYIAIDKKRGRKGMDNIGILPTFTGIAVHDCWGSYFQYGDCDHALCGAHLLRELTGVEENTSQIWASDMKQLLLRMKTVKERYIDKEKAHLSGYYQQKFSSEYDRLIDVGKIANPLLQREEGKRGKPKKGTIRCLIERLETYKGEVCRFVENFDVPFDNNQAERDIRNFKVKEKVSGGFRTDDGVNNYAAIISYISTARKHGISIFDAIQFAISDNTSAVFRCTTE